MNGVTIVYLTAAVTGQDDLGNDVITWSASEISGCAFVPGATSEATEGTEQVRDDAGIYLPPGSKVSSPLDRIQYAGETWQVQGASSSWESPFTGARAPVLVPLRHVEGATEREAGVAEGA
jgi:hypothetical protein